MARLSARQAAGTSVNFIVEKTRPKHGRRPSGGVSLVEAMVALAVMAFGMLALVGVQATLRMNNDLAKQRSEATLIATREVELMRNYFTLLTVAGQSGSWEQIVSHAAEAYIPPESIGNTSYQVARTVNTDTANRQKTFKVEVTWPDRTGITQRVVLDGMVWGVVPELSTLLAIPTRPSATNQINGREVTIPAGVVDVGDQSRFTPPGSALVAWMFNRTTGALNVCSVDGTSNCRSARFVSGEVRFHRPASGAVTAAHAENPQGPAWLNLAAGPSAMMIVFPVNLTDVTGASCYADTYTAAQLAEAAVPRVTGIKYYCAVISSGTLGWGGQLNPRLVNPATGAVVIPGVESDVKVCRYTTASTDPDFTNNEDHPKTYCAVTPTTLTVNLSCNLTRVNGNLINQNFLVIPGSLSCPTDTAINLATGDLLNTNTQQHQP